MKNIFYLITTLSLLNNYISNGQEKRYKIGLNYLSPISGDYKYYNNVFGLGILTQIDIYDINNQFSIYGDISPSYITGKGTYNVNKVYNQNSYFIPIHAGVNYRVNNFNIGLAGGFGYYNYNYDLIGLQRSSNLGFSHSSTITYDLEKFSVLFKYDNTILNNQYGISNSNISIGGALRF